MSTVGFDTRQRQYRGTADQHGVCGGLYLFRVAETGKIDRQKVCGDSQRRVVGRATDT